MIVRDSGFIAALTVLAEDLHTQPTDPQNDLHMRDLLVEWLARNYPGSQLQEHHMDGANILVRRVRDALADDGFYAVAVNEGYFAKKAQAEAHGDGPYPHNETQARKSLARGSARAVGLHFHTGADDLLFEAYVLSHTREGAGKYARNVNVVVAAMGDGKISIPQAGRILRAGDRLLVLDNPAAIRQAIEQAADEPEMES